MRQGRKILEQHAVNEDIPAANFVKKDASRSIVKEGVVADFGAVVLMMQWPHMKHGDAHWEITLLHILQ